MTAVRFVLRFFGWLLTPFVAWAASFLGATAGAVMGRGLPATTGVIVSVALGGGAALVALIVWLRLLRRSPRLQHALEVSEDGTPVVALESSTEEVES
jgi:hypothetical protein